MSANCTDCGFDVYETDTGWECPMCGLKKLKQQLDKKDKRIKELEEQFFNYRKERGREYIQLKEAEKVFKLARHGCECELDNQTCYVCSIAEYFKKYPDSVEKLN